VQWDKGAWPQRPARRPCAVRVSTYGESVPTKEAVVHPVDLTAERSERHSRWPAFFRLFMVIPHAIVSGLWSLAALVLVVIAWFVIIFAGRFPAGMHSFVKRSLIYSTQVSGYAMLLTDRFPAFGPSDTYPVRVSIEGPERHRRVTTLFRPILAFPALVASYLLSYGIGPVVFLQWLVILFTGSVPAGLHDFVTFVQRYSLRLNAYLFFLVDAYPSMGRDGALTAAPSAPAPAEGEQPAAW
jgi:Domain of unknown function (DUF4389)